MEKKKEKGGGPREKKRGVRQEGEAGAVFDGVHSSLLLASLIPEVPVG